MIEIEDTNQRLCQKLFLFQGMLSIFVPLRYVSLSERKRVFALLLPLTRQ